MGVEKHMGATGVVADTRLHSAVRLGVECDRGAFDIPGAVRAAHPGDVATSGAGGHGRVQVFGDHRHACPGIEQLADTS